MLLNLLAFLIGGAWWFARGLQSNNGDRAADATRFLVNRNRKYAVISFLCYSDRGNLRLKNSVDL